MPEEKKTTEGQENPNAEEKPLTRTEINDIISKAVGHHVKKAVRGIKPSEPEKSKLDNDDDSESPPSNSAPPTNPDYAALMRRLEKQDNEIKELKKKERASHEKARSASVNSQLTQSLKGKVADEWLGDAVEKVSKRVQFTKDDAPEFSYNDSVYSLEDGVSEWLKDPENKRFLPAPKTAIAAKKTEYTAPKLTTSNDPNALTFEQRVNNVLARTMAGKS